MFERPWSIALTRFGFGRRPSEIMEGGPEAWLKRQIEDYDPFPAALRSLAPSQPIVEQAGEFRRLPNTDQDMKREARIALRDHVQESIGARIALAVQSSAPFAERLVQFWANHFAVSTDKPVAAPLAGAFEAEAIRPHIFGRFSDMLHAAEMHPAMLIYLDQAQSIGPESLRGQRVAQRAQRRAGLNENLAREILELHTLGVRSGYTQSDVTEFAKALTGHTVPALVRGGQRNRQAYAFLPQLHEPGAKIVLGKTYREGGANEARRILDDLAANVATARHIATKFARHFSADEPPASLVSRLEQNFLATGGDLKQLTVTLIDSPETWDAGRRKFLSPWEWSIASLRALDLRDFDPMPVRRLMMNMGQDLWKPGSPAGFDDTVARWASPEALQLRAEAAQSLGRRGVRQDARALGPLLYPGIWSEQSAQSVKRAESAEQAMGLLLASPEAMWR